MRRYKNVLIVCWNLNGLVILKKGTFILKFTLNLIMICINVHTSIYVIFFKSIKQFKYLSNQNAKKQTVQLHI